MSVYVLSWVLKHSPAEKSDRLVLLVLADKANEDGGEAYPSVETMQAEARLRSRRTVQEALDVLKGAAAIAAVGTHRRGMTVYTVSTDLGEQDWSGVYKTYPLLGKAKNAPPAKTAGAEKSGGGAQKTPPADAKNAPEPSVLHPPIEPPDSSSLEVSPPIWLAVRERLQGAVTDYTFHVWLEPLELQSFNGTHVVLTAPDHIRSWVAERYLPLIRRAFVEKAGGPVSVDIVAPPRARRAAA